MARPTRHNADYYTHDADLRNDRRVKAIRTKFGAAGYGLLHMLLEALTDADHTQLDTDPLEIELLAGDFGVSATEIHDLLQFGESIGYFTRNETGLLGCPELSKWLEPVFEKRNRTRNASPAALLSQPAAKTGVSVAGIHRVKESKEENRREKRMDGSQPASQPSSFSSSESEKPAEVKGPPKGLPAQAEVFKTAGFSAYVTKMGFSHIDRGVYLPDIQRKAEMMKQERDEAGWENFVIEFLKKEKAAGKLLTRELGKASEQVHFVVPPPPSQQTTPEAIARQAELDAQAAARTKAHLARWAAKRHTNAAE